MLRANGGTKPPKCGAGFAFFAKGVTGVAVGFSDLLGDRIYDISPFIIESHKQVYGTVVVNRFLSLLQIICIVCLPDTTAAGMLPPGLTHCPAM